MSTTADKGFVSFSLYQDNNILPGTRVLNKTDIIFDYEEPLGINEVTNTIWGRQSAGKQNKRTIYPNPVTGEETHIRTSSIQSDTRIKDLVVITADGRMVYSEHDINALEFTLYKKDIVKPGVNMISVVDYNSEKYAGILMVQ